jgi:hypothetical protein
MNEAVPSDALALERWLLEQVTMPEWLVELGERAMLTLYAMEAGAAHQSEVTDAMNKRDLQAFVEAYEAFRASGFLGLVDDATGMTRGYRRIEP